MKAKKLLALLLAVVMICALSTTAFAADPADKPIVLTNHVYDLYQIFSGDEDTKNTNGLTNIRWGDDTFGAAFLTALQTSTSTDFIDAKTGKNMFADCKYAADVAAVITGFNYNSDAAKLFAEIAWNVIKDTNVNLQPKYKQAVADSTAVDSGYYLVVDVTNLDNLTAAGKDYTEIAHNINLLDVTTGGKFQVRVKNTVPEVDKAIRKANGATYDLVNVGDYTIGDTVTYQLKGSISSAYADYLSYYYLFTDTMNAGLTPCAAADIKVYLDDDSDPNNEFEPTSADNSVQGFAITVDTTGAKPVITAECKDLKLAKTKNGDVVDASSKILVVYTATVNENATVVDTGNENEVMITFTNDPNWKWNPNIPNDNGPTGETPKDWNKVFFTELVIKKVDEQGNILTGAEFTLTGETLNQVITWGEVFVADTNGAYWQLTGGRYTTIDPNTVTDQSEYVSTTQKYDKKTQITQNAVSTGNPTQVSAFVDSTTGLITFRGLKAGKYTLTETVTPKGYNTIDPIYFEVVATVAPAGNTFITDPSNITCTWTTKDLDANGNATGNASKIQVKDGTDGVYKEGVLYTEIVNKSGSVLPETGGIGTTIFTVGGIVLMLGAAILLITKRRMSGVED